MSSDRSWLVSTNPVSRLRRTPSTTARRCVASPFSKASMSTSRISLTSPTLGLAVRSRRSGAYGRRESRCGRSVAHMNVGVGLPTIEPCPRTTDSSASAGPSRHPADAARAWPGAAGRRAAVGQARRSHRAGRRRQQSSQAGVPLRRGARRRSAVAGDRRCRPVEPLPDDRSRGGRARARRAPRVVGRPARSLPRATSCCPCCSAPSSTSSAAHRATGANWRSPASSSPRSSSPTAPPRTRSRSAGARRPVRSATSPATSS